MQKGWGSLMRGEPDNLRRQLKGHLFELTLQVLLQKNGFIPVVASREPGNRIRENRKGFVEVRGRGCWHQIDCLCDYQYMVPFSYPLRMIGEAKYYSKHLSKRHMRAFIGVLKDIQENYFISDTQDVHESYPRRTEIGVYFAANGFQKEAEKLAYVHGIKTISYKNHAIINKIKRGIDDLEENMLSVNCM